MWLFNTTLTHFVIGYLYGGGEPVNDFTVDTIYGTVRGTKSAVSRNGRSYYEFQGIPYAQPPIGDLRFEPPVPPYTWDGILNATSPGNRCLQIRLVTNTKLGDEDCLNLNVFTHQVQPRRDLKQLDKLNPVIYYIHGGFFMGGSADVFGVKYYMDEDVVFVTANYRVAALGFLNTGDEESSGNMGLKDQVMVLRWIQENIMYFGGDPNRVTIIGESAGGAAANYHMFSPLSRGLFHRVICQSGNVLAPWALNPNPIEQSQIFAAKLNCTRNSTKEMVACLRLLPGKTLIEGHRDTIHHLHHSDTLFVPTVEAVQGPWTFLNDTPLNIMKNNGTANVPMIVGANAGEGLAFAAMLTKNETRRTELNTHWNKYAPQVFNYENSLLRDEISAKIRHYYFKGQNMTLENWQNTTNMMSDYYFLWSVHKVGKLYQSGVVQSPLYLYYFAYEAQFSLGKMAWGMSGSLPVMADVVLSAGARWVSTNLLGREEKHYGAAHADEVFLMFEMPLQNVHKEGTMDYEMSRNLIKLWMSFVRDGKPEDLQQSHWESVNSGDKGTQNSTTKLRYMRLDKRLELVDEPFNERVEFWKSLDL